MSAGFGSKSGQLKANAAATRNTGPGSTASFMEAGGQQRAATGAAPLEQTPMGTPDVGRDRGGLPSAKDESGPLARLNNPNKFRTITYPRNADAVDHYMTIKAFETQFFPAFGGQRENSNTLGRVILPMPSNLIAGYSQEYKNEQLGVAGQILGSALKEQFDAGKMTGALDATRTALQNPGLQTGKDAINKSSDFIAGTIRSLSSKINEGVVRSVALAAAKDGAATLAGAASLGLGGAALAAGASKGIEAFAASQGLARNPHAAVMYDSPNFRAFNFQWELRPKNYYESIQIARLVAFFKYYSAPSFAEGYSNHFFKYPNQFKLKIKHDEFMFAFGECILKNFEVDYHGEGTPLYYDAAGSTRSANRRLKAPAVVKISTEWQETSIVTKEAIEREGR
ncbi:MAG: hypothetical protein CL554_16690 [Algoriphagus sp.]|uniref:baseplate tail-tube junction protein n=1 Tax=Algoriphagus sp. TaxID=1872435 RepID=UPI000C5362E4|nr:baseplate tail-tube junction protein [Algoriphagus sp.]MAL15051.1 hypothetical protein [Algoriphagus sp.]